MDFDAIKDKLTGYKRLGLKMFRLLIVSNSQSCVVTHHQPN
jgi:hypothetical protein